MYVSNNAPLTALRKIFQEREASKVGWGTL